MINCPNLSNPEVKQEFEELVGILGESQAYRVWSMNGGNHLSKTKEGKDNPVFKQLEKDLSREEAITEMADRITGMQIGIQYNSQGEVLAPNGKVSKLFKDIESLEEVTSNEQALQLYKQTRSKEFKEWFGDSKVVDENGEPLIVYHGTNTGIKNDAFNKEFLGSYTNAASSKQGFFFASNSENATFYSDGELNIILSKRDYNLIKPKKRLVINEELNNLLKNKVKEELYKEGEVDEYSYILEDYDEDTKSFVITSRKGKKGSYLNGEEGDQVIEQYLIDNNKKYLIKKEFKETKEQQEILGNKIEKEYGINPFKFGIYPFYLNIKNPKEYSDKKKEYREESYFSRIVKAKNENKDGVIIKETKDPIDTDVYVTFEPNQIKSVFNVGEFSSTNDNIYNQLDVNWNDPLLSRNETLPADPKLDERLEAFLTKYGFNVKALQDKDLDYVAKVDIMNKIIEIVEGKRKLSTLSEEVAHIFVELLPDNSPLLAKMMKDIVGFEVYNEIYDKYKDIYLTADENGIMRTDENMVKKEAIGKAIANEIINQNNVEKEANSGVIKKWFNRLLDWIRSRLGKNGSISFNEDVYAFREAAKMILEGNPPNDASYENIIKRYPYSKEVVYYQVDEADEKAKFDDLISKFEKDVIKPSKEGGYETVSGKKILNRVSDWVKSFYRNIFGDETDTEEGTILRKKGTYIHKILEVLMSKVIAIDPNQDLDINSITIEANKISSNYREIQEQAAKDLINNNKDFEGMSIDDDFFKLGRLGRTGITMQSKENFEKLLKLTIAKYRNIKERQANINKFNGTNGKFKIFLEYLIYDPERDVAGTIDMMVVYSNSSVGVYDWKGIRFKTQKGKVTVTNVPEVKERAYEIQLGMYKSILKAQYGVEKFGETRVIPINMQLNFANQEKGFYNIEAGNTGKTPYLNEIPLDNEMIPEEVEGHEYLNNALNKLYSKRNELRTLVDNKNDLSSNLAKYEKVKRLIKNIQLRKEYKLLISEMHSLINEYDSREQLADNENQITLTDIVNYQNYADIYSDVISDIILAIENDEVLKENASILKSNLEIFKKRLNFKTQEFVNEKENINLNDAVKEESSLGRTFKSLFDFSQPAFRVMANTVAENQNKVRQEFNTIYDEVTKKTKKLGEWAKKKGKSLQGVYNEIIVEENGTLKLQSKYNNLFKEEKTKAIENKDIKWFLDNALIDKRVDDLTNQIYYVYTGIAAEKFKVAKEKAFKRFDKDYAGDEYAEEREAKKEEWMAKYDVSFSEDALFNDRNFFIKMKEQEKYMSDFWKNALQPGNEALRDYYEMYTRLNEEFSGMTGNSVNTRFIANVAKDLADGIAENGPIAFFRIGGMIKKALEVRQNDAVMGSTVNGEKIRTIPLLFTDSLTEEITKNERNSIIEEVKNIKDEKGKPKYIEGSKAFNDMVSSKEFTLSKQKGNKYKSRDLSKSLMLFANSALSYKHLSETEDIVKSILYYMKSGAGAHHATDKYGRRIKDAYDNTVVPALGTPKKEIELYEKFIDALWYGQRTQNKDKLLFDKYSMTKGVQKTMQYIAVKALGLNAFVAFGNIINTFSNVVMSGAEGIYFKKAIRKTLDMLRDENQRKKFLAASALFEPFATNTKYLKVNKISASKVSKLLTMDNLFYLMRKPDEFAEMTILNGMMHQFGIKDGKLTRLTTENDPDSINNRLKYDAAKDTWYVEGMTDKDFVKFRQMVIHVSYKLKGNKGEGYISSTDLTIYTQALMQFRTWMPGVIQNRFGATKYNEDIMMFEQGRFLTFAGELHGAWSEKLKALGSLAKEMMFIKSFNAKDGRLNQEAAKFYFEKFLSENPSLKGKVTLQQFLEMREAKLRGMAAELRMFAMLYMLVSLMGRLLFGGDDEEKQDAVMAFFSRNSYRIANRGLLELSFFFNFQSTLRSFVISPAAILKPIKDLPKLIANTRDEIIDSLYGENSPNDKTGWWYYGLDYIPVGNQVIDFFDYFGTWNIEQEF